MLRAQGEGRITEVGVYRFFAGWGSDPFFFDTASALNNLQFTGNDFFADKDVCSIVLELPNSALTSASGLNVWHRVLVPADVAASGWVQVERGARSSQTPSWQAKPWTPTLSEQQHRKVATSTGDDYFCPFGSLRGAVSPKRHLKANHS
jgi:hypothetical protein